MRILKSEKQAIVDILIAGADTPDEMADILWKKTWELVGERDFVFALIEVAGFKRVIGPFSTAKQAQRGAEKHGADRAWIAGGVTAEATARIFAAVDEPPTPSIDPMVPEDAKLFKLGWRGNNRDRQTYVQMLANA